MQLGQSANLEKTMSVRRRLTQTLQMTFSNVDRFEDMDSDMILIRQAELIILKEEEKYGKHSRDSQGRVVPFLQVNKALLRPCGCII